MPVALRKLKTLIPVSFGMDDATALRDMAEQRGLSEEELIRLAVSLLIDKLAARASYGADWRLPVYGGQS